MDKPLIKKYLIWTFLLTYTMWGIIILANEFGYLKYGTPISIVLYLIGVNSPPIVTITILKKSNKITNVWKFLKKVFNVKQKFKYYLLTVAFLLPYFGVPALMSGISKGSKLSISILFIPVMIVVGGLEELGWRGILQPQLEKSFSFGTATCFTACIWAVWHLPLFFIVGTMQSTMNFGMFTIMVFGMSFTLAAIRRKSNSVWLCILFHGMVNSLASSWIIADSLPVKLSTTIVLIICSFIVILPKKALRAKR